MSAAKRGRPWQLLLAALLIVMAVVVVAEPSQVSAAKRCGRAVTFGDWTRLPIFEFETTVVSSSVDWPVVYAVDPDNSRLLYASSSHQILRSTDGGCSWSKAWEVPLAPTSEFPYSQAMSPRITSLVVGDARRGPNPVHLALDIGRGIDQVHLVRSDDAGVTWVSADSREYLHGWYPQLAVAHSDADKIYLSYLMSLPKRGPGIYVTFRIYHASEDGGRTWEMRSDVLTEATGELDRPDSLVVHPTDPQTLWDWSPLRRSTDGARTWQAVRETAALKSEQDRQTIDVEVYAAPSGPPQIVALQRTGKMLVSRNGGRSWSKLPRVPGTDESSSSHLHPESVMFGSRAGVAVYGIRSLFIEVWTLERKRGGGYAWRDISPQHVGLAGKNASTAYLTYSRGSGELYFNSEDGLERYDGNF